MKLLLVFVLFAAALSFSGNATEVVSSKPFSSKELFEKLDSAGRGATWMEFDAGGILDPEVGKFIADAQGKIKKDVEHVWLLEVPGKGFQIAVLRTRKTGEVLSFAEMGKLSAKPVPLRLREPFEFSKVFRDYRETAPGHFEHLDDPRLQVFVRDSEIQFSYQRPDLEALSPVTNFDQMSELEKRQEIQTRRDFYAYEYSLMVRAFVGSTRGLFNWQIWHWFLPKWTSGGEISDREIVGALSMPDQGKFVRIFSKELPGGDFVEMLSNAHGSFLMNIRRR